MGKIVRHVGQSNIYEESDGSTRGECIIEMQISFLKSINLLYD
jgi:hypothetical protein